MTLENAKLLAFATVLDSLNSYEIVENKTTSAITWKINFYEGETLILDDKPTLIEYKIPNVFEITFRKYSENLWKIEKTPSIEEISTNLTRKYQSIINYLEKIVLKVTWIDLLKIPQISNAITPFFDILKRISKLGFISVDDIGELEKKRRKSFDKYIRLLLLNDIIEKGEKGYHFSNTAISILSKTRDKEKSVKSILSYFIYNAAPQLIHGMKLYSLNSYAYLENAYYIPNLQIQTMKKFRLDTYEKMYVKINKRKLPKAYIFSLYRLEDAGIIEVINDTHIIGVENKYEQMQGEFKDLYKYS